MTFSKAAGLSVLFRKVLSGDFGQAKAVLPIGHSPFKLAGQRPDTCNGGSFHDESM